MNRPFADGGSMDPAWDDYRQRRLASRSALLLALVWILPGSVIRHNLVSHGWDESTALVLAVASPMLVILSVTHLRRMLWPCPRCGRPFHASWCYGNLFARRCVHCGLPKWAPMQKPAKTDLL